MSLEPGTMTPLEGPFNLDELRVWVSDTRKVGTGNSFQVVRMGDLFDELLFGNAEKFKPLVGKILDADKQYRFRHDLVDDLSISVINLPNGKMVMGVVTPVKADAKFLIDGYEVPIDPVKPTMIIGIQTKDDLDNTGRGLFIVSQASDLMLPPKILTEPQGGAYLEGDVADVIATAIGYKDVIAIKNGDVMEGIKAAALPVPILPDTADIFVFGFVHPKDPNLIAWTQPVSIRRGEAAPAKIVSQSQNQDVEAGAEVVLDMDVEGTPPPDCFWIPQVNGVDGRPIRGKQLNVRALYTTTYIPKAVNSYKAGAGDRFDPNGALKEFSDRGDAVTVKPQKQEQIAPANFINDDVNNTADFSYVPGIIDFTKYERTFDGGVTFAKLTKKPFDVPDADIAAGKIGVRVSETEIHNASPWVFNTQPFNTSIVPTDFTLTSNQENLIQNGKVFTSTINTGYGWRGDDFISNKSLKAGAAGWIQYKKGTSYGAMSFDTVAGHGDAITDKLLSILEYNGRNSGFSVYYNGQSIVTQDLNDETPYVRLNRASNGTITVQRLNADGSIFDTVSTPGIPAITQELFVSINVAAVSTNDRIVEPRYFGISNI